MQTILRWSARFSALALACLFLIFVSAEVISPHSGPPSKMRDFMGIGLLSVACLAPILGWWRELLAALISLTALAGFALMTKAGRIDTLLIMGIPGILYLGDWILRNPPWHSRVQ